MNKIMKTLTIWAIFSLLLVGLALAQPQAPITWGEARWFGIGCNEAGIQHLSGTGDTIVVIDQRRDTTLPNDPYYPVITVSSDNGEHWRDWRRFLPDSVHSGLIYTLVASVSGKEYAWIYRAIENDFWVMRSLDAGASWTRIRQRSGRSVTFGLALHSEVIAAEGYSTTDTSGEYDAYHSADYGTTWGAADVITTRPISFAKKCAAATQTHAIAVGRHRVGANLRLGIYASNGARSWARWENFDELPGPDLGDLYTYTVAGDTLSETAIVASVWYPTGGWEQNIYVHRTTNGGSTWQEPLLITDHGTGAESPEIFCAGKLWALAWQDYASQDTAQWGVYYRLSANHGKNWYPEEEAVTPCRGGYCNTGQFVGNEIRLYWSGVPDTSYHQKDYGMAAGTLRVDSLAPEIVEFRIPADTVVTGSAIDFAARAHDSDTLSEVRVSVRSDQDSSWTVFMNRVVGDTFATSWTVPREGFYRFRIEAEDFWENVGSYPDTGWASFVTEHWSGADQIVLHPLSFSLSSYPNPFNATTVISFSVPKAGEVKISLYDITGRLARVLDNRRVEAGEHRIVLNAEGIASGIYFVRLEGTNGAITTKLILLR
jgi:hypothetical protein